MIFSLIFFTIFGQMKKSAFFGRVWISLNPASKLGRILFGLILAGFIGLRLGSSPGPASGRAWLGPFGADSEPQRPSHTLGP